jgi:hypothetical protein
VSAVASLGLLVDLQRVGVDDAELAGVLPFKFGKGRNTAAVSFNGNDRSAGFKKRICETAGSGANLIGRLAFEGSWHCRNPCQQLAVEDEVLTQRLAGLEPVPRDDIAQRLRL